MKTIVAKQHEQRNAQQEEEKKKIEIYPDEKKNVTHSRLLTL
ncbi:MAG: hypothetical protein ABIR19_07510 [Ginsengibacter sp.]